MFLLVHTRREARQNMLRTSGDVSELRYLNSRVTGYAPHERRCFLSKPASMTFWTICSARAEMFLADTRHVWPCSDMLRTSGDVSLSCLMSGGEVEYAPHERRCFSLGLSVFVSCVICSARAEMFPKILSITYTSTRYAPHERRCFSPHHTGGSS